MIPAGESPAPTRLFLALVLSAALFAAVPAWGQQAGDGWRAAVAGRMIAHINRHRMRDGLAPLRAEPLLDRAAQRHASDMADNDFFGHDGSDGSGIGARASHAGYGWRRIAENVSAGAESPEEVVDGWMASEGHRRNLLRPGFRDAGVGYAFVDPDPGRARYRHYWSLVLGAPAER
jgi:uncharacterized protein YkwD